MRSPFISYTGWFERWIEKTETPKFGSGVNNILWVESEVCFPSPFTAGFYSAQRMHKKLHVTYCLLQRLCSVFALLTHWEPEARIGIICLACNYINILSEVWGLLEIWAQPGISGSFFLPFLCCSQQWMQRTGRFIATPSGKGGRERQTELHDKTRSL